MKHTDEHLAVLDAFDEWEGVDEGKTKKIPSKWHSIRKQIVLTIY